MINDRFLPSFVDGKKDCYIDEGDEIKIKQQYTETIENGSFNFINIWGFTYYITFDKAEIIYYESDDLVERIYSAVIYGMKYSVDNISFKPVTSMWGDDEVIEVDNGTIKTKMFLPEEHSFMQRICEEIFADG